jgi:type I restriction enzyme S subunit
MSGALSRLRLLASNPTDKPGEEYRPFIALEDLEGAAGRLAVTELPKASEPDGVAFEAGDVLFSKLRPYLAKTLLAKEPGYATSELLVLRPGPRLRPDYLHAICRSRPLLQWAQATSYGVKMPRTSWEALADLKIMLPGIEEQEQIVRDLDARLSVNWRLVEQYKRLLEVLHEARLVNLLEAVTGQGPYEPEGGSRRSTGLTWAPTLPSHWRSGKITRYARLGSGHTPSRKRPEWWTNCTIGWITTGEVSQVRDDRQETITDTREKISELGVENSSAEVHPAGTVVLCRTAASAGYSAVMGDDMATSQDFATWTCGPELDPTWLLYCLRAMRPDLLGRLTQGSTHKTIYMPDLEALRVPVPPLAEQQAIIEAARQRLTANDQLQDAIQAQLNVLAEHREAEITAAVAPAWSTPGGRTWA